MEVKKAIYERRSIREFTDQKISREILEDLVEAGAQAPNGRGFHEWKFTVIQAPELISELAGLIAKTQNRDPKTYDFYGPNALILVSDNISDTNWLANCSCALQNIFLRAHDLGLGSVWINQLKTICDEPEIRNFLDKVNLPKDHIVGGIAALGYPKGDNPTKNKPVNAAYFL